MKNYLILLLSIFLFSCTNSELTEYEKFKSAETIIDQQDVMQAFSFSSFSCSGSEARKSIAFQDGTTEAEACAILTDWADNLCAIALEINEPPNSCSALGGYYACTISPCSFRYFADGSGFLCSIRVCLTCIIEQ